MLYLLLTCFRKEGVTCTWYGNIVYYRSKIIVRRNTMCYLEKPDVTSAPARSRVARQFRVTASYSFSLTCRVPENKFLCITKRKYFLLRTVLWNCNFNRLTICVYAYKHIRLHHVLIGLGYQIAVCRRCNNPVDALFPIDICPACPEILTAYLRYSKSQNLQYLPTDFPSIIHVSGYTLQPLATRVLSWPL